MTEPSSGDDGARPTLIPGPPRALPPTLTGQGPASVGGAPTPRLLAGRYLLGEELGRGGQAVVYRAHDRTLGVDRAIKVLGIDATGHASLLRRLRTEARAMAGLEHPNILAVFDFGRDAESDFIVMQLAEGGSLEDRLEHRGPLQPGLAVRYMVQVLSALGAAHAAGIVHRDVKPGNVLLDADDRVLLADFGVALLGGNAAERRTAAGTPMGSFWFMPPEQRIDASAVGVVADLYAVGSTLYALVTGENPVDLFTAPRDSYRWERCPEPLRDVLFRATRPDPAERFKTARQMAMALLSEASFGAGGRLASFSDPGADDSAFLSAVTFIEALPTASTAGGRLVPALAPSPASGGRWAPWLAALLVCWVALLVAVVAGLSLSNPAQPPPPSLSPLSPPPASSLVPSPSAEHSATAGPAPGRKAPERVYLRAPPVDPDPPRPEGVASGVVSWSGSLGGRTAELVLSGADGEVRGEVVVRFLGNEIRSAVQGRIDRDGGRMDLRDLDVGADLGRYRGEVSPDGARLQGTLQRSDGRIVPFSFVKKP